MWGIHATQLDHILQSGVARVAGHDRPQELDEMDVRVSQKKLTLEILLRPRGEQKLANIQTITETKDRPGPASTL